MPLSVRKCLLATLVFTPGCIEALLHAGPASDPSSGMSRVGAHRPARPSDCQLLVFDPADGDASMRSLQQIGVVLVRVAETTGPLDGETKTLLRANACEMGGTHVSLFSSGKQQRDSRLGEGVGMWATYSFAVWAAPEPRQAARPL